MTERKTNSAGAFVNADASVPVPHAVALDHLWVWVNAQTRKLEIGNRLAASVRASAAATIAPLPRIEETNTPADGWGWQADLALDDSLPSVRLQLDVRLSDPRFQAILAPLRTPRAPAATLSMVGRPGGPVEIFRDNAHLRTRPPPRDASETPPSAWDSLADLIEFWLGKPNVLCLLHGAAMERDGRSWVFLGESGAGKSVFCNKFAATGARYISDDTVIIEKNRSALVRWPACPSVKSDAWPVISENVPGLAQAPALAKGDDRVKLLTDASFIPQLRAEKPAAFIFLRYEAGCATKCVELSIDEAMLRLKHTQAWIPPEHLDQSMALLRETPLLALRYSDFADATRWLCPLTE